MFSWMRVPIILFLSINSINTRTQYLRFGSVLTLVWVSERERVWQREMAHSVCLQLQECDAWTLMKHPPIVPLIAFLIEISAIHTWPRPRRAFYTHLSFSLAFFTSLFSATVFSPLSLFLIHTHFFSPTNAGLAIEGSLARLSNSDKQPRPLCRYFN